MNESLAIVLPVRNAERSLARDVQNVLDAAAELSPSVELVVVDDASTDDTHDIASELAQRYPQVRVMRRHARKNLTESLRLLRSQIEADVVIVHDGASRVNPEQLRMIWTQQRALGMYRASNQGVSFADLRRPAQTHPQLVEAHRRLLGFQSLVAEQHTDGVATQVEAENQRMDEPSNPVPKQQRKGVGAIPALPKPNLFGALTDFALGE